MNEINKGYFEEIKELDEEQNYSSGFNSQRSGDKGINESKYSQMKGSVIDEEDAEEAFTEEEPADIIDLNERDKGDFVNLETPMNVDKSRGLLDKEGPSGLEGESSGNEVNMFEFKGLQQSGEEGKKLIVSEAFVDEETRPPALPQEDVLAQEEVEVRAELPGESKPGDEANPNTPLINKGIEGSSPARPLETDLGLIPAMRAISGKTKDILVLEKEPSSYMEDSVEPSERTPKEPQQRKKVIKTVSNLNRSFDEVDTKKKADPKKSGEAWSQGAAEDPAIG